MASTPATNPQCADWSGFLDLAEVGIPQEPVLDGDSIAVNAFSAIGPFEQYGGQFPNLVVSEDGAWRVTGTPTFEIARMGAVARRLEVEALDVSSFAAPIDRLLAE